MRVTWHGTLTFGLVTVPVGLVKAQGAEKPLSFRQLHRDCGLPVKQPKVCPEHGEITLDETCKGYEVEKGVFVAFEESDLEALAPDKSKTIAIQRFVPLEGVDPIVLDRTYYLMPADEVEQRKGYALLMEAMERTGKGAVAQFVLWGKENLAMIRPMDGVLALDLLYYTDDLRDAQPIRDRLLAAGEVREEEVQLAEALIGGLSGDFEHDAFEDGHRREVRAFVESLAGGKKPKATKAKAAAPSTDVLKALKASVAAQSKAKRVVKPKPRARAKR